MSPSWVRPHGCQDGGRVVHRCVGPVAVRQEVVLDELDDRVEAERLVIDVAAAGVGADHQRRDSDAIAVLIDVRREDVVVEVRPDTGRVVRHAYKPSCRGRADDRMARMMRKSNHARSPSDAALLLFCKASDYWFATVAAAASTTWSRPPGDRQIVRSAQPAAADRSLPARPAALA